MTPDAPSALRVARAFSVVRDLLVAAVGVAVLISTPPSLVEFGGADAAALAWSLLPLIGGTLSAAGILRNSVGTEVVGSFTVASGFLVWAAAAVAQPGTTLTSFAVAGAFAALALGAVVRGLVVATGLLNGEASA